MKIKGKFENLKIESAFYVFAFGTALALGLRIWQAFNIIEYNTGFFTQKNFTVTLMYIIIAVTAIAIIAISFLCGNVPEEKAPEKKSIPLAVTSVLMMVTLFVNGIQRFSDFGTLFKNYPYINQQQTMISYLMKSGALPKLAEAIFGLLSIIWFLMILLQYVGVKGINIKNNKALAVCPLFWATGRIIQRFTRTISFVNVSGLLLELFMIAFMMMFFMYFAQMVSGINSKAISFKVYAYGLCSAMFAVIATVPRIILLIANPAFSYTYLGATSDVTYRTATALACPLEWCDVAYAIFVFVLLLALLSNTRIKNMTLKETEELEKKFSNEDASVEEIKK